MKNKSLLFVFSALVMVARRGAHAANVPLPRSTLEAQGISSQAILNFVNAAAGQTSPTINSTRNFSYVLSN
jgi:hypothetical protein